MKAGDAKLPDIEWKTNYISGHSYLTYMNKCLLSTVYDICLEQFVKFPTRGENTLDIFLTNRPSLIEKCKPVPGVSDHDIVFVKASTTTEDTPMEACRYCKHEARNDVLSFSNKLTSRCTTGTDVNTVRNSFKELTSNL